MRKVKSIELKRPLAQKEVSFHLATQYSLVTLGKIRSIQRLFHYSARAQFSTYPNLHRLIMTSINNLRSLCRQQMNFLSHDFAEKIVF